MSNAQGNPDKNIDLRFANLSMLSVMKYATKSNNIINVRSNAALIIYWWNGVSFSDHIAVITIAETAKLISTGNLADLSSGAILDLL